MDYSVLPSRKKEILEHVGSMRQIAGIKRYILDDGVGRGVRAADIWNGSGLAFTVLFDRGMDIGPASYKGLPLAFMTSAGDFSNPAYYSPEGIEWLRNFGGGLLAGCGMRNVGSPSNHGGENFGLHGRLSNIPAFNCSTSEEWKDGRYTLELAGYMREARFFGENMFLKRKISTEMGANVIRIEDMIENQSNAPSHFMLLYHINIGFPMLCEKSYIRAVEHKVLHRDNVAEDGLKYWDKCQKPVLGFAEQCFYHDIPAGKDGFSRISMVNPTQKLELEVAYRKAELPFLTQWKQMGSGNYVTGFEPANCHVSGAAKENEMGTLKMLQPGETVSMCVCISVKEI